MRMSRVWLTVLALAGTAGARPAGAQGAFEVGGFMGLDAADTGGASSSGHLALGLSVAYSYTNRSLTSRSGAIGTARFSYLHATSEGGPLTQGRIGLDNFVIPSLALGWRTKSLEAGLAADYRVEAFFIDSTTVQAFTAQHAPGHLRGMFFGPYVSLGLDPLGGAGRKLRIEASYQWGSGYRFGTLFRGEDDDIELDLSLQSPRVMTGRLSYAATPHVVLRLEYQDLDYPTVVESNAGVARPFDVRHRALLAGVALRQR